MLLFVAGSVVAPGRAIGAVVPEPGFTVTTIARTPDIRQPHAIKFAPDGRLFLLEQNQGDVRVVQNGQLIAGNFLHLDVQTGGSRGLLGITFAPNFAANGYVYISYTTNAGGFVHNRVSRFTSSGNAADPTSEVVLFEGLDLEDKTMHYGGDLNFGPDGKLYISVGDRLGLQVAQQLNTTWGKMLRLNKDGTIPSDNPFYGQTTGLNRAIWALGLRNPFKFMFQPICLLARGRFGGRDAGTGVPSGITGLH